ncbi:hypothetical protein [Dokdonella fugitiva]|jgi:hypothetical protein|uniref:Uncharacterized protein n=1 Tax=Dokdonella fugitiva TaxID=328517 RepID=A0A4R2IBG6_9GAMM|nr:hypothetical protein [Dokdonella fugitiva]MBA8884771.1 hypothetical protein [Dokdonella fugitiva]TCO40788.1 hypothetical protein EV148_104150 [Dokdonella fugitiva]
MQRSLEIRELLVAISRLPEGRRTRRDVWYESQKEHWIGWLFHYNSAGAYGRKITSGRDAKFVYNHVVCPGLLTYLAAAAGVSPTRVRQARRIENSEGSLMARVGAIRQLLPWELVQDALLKNGFVRMTD